MAEFEPEAIHQALMDFNGRGRRVPRRPLQDLLDQCARAERGDDGGSLNYMTTPF
jgi:hypothetical protein